MTVRTTVLVGFPGETEAAFERLLEFLDEVRFDRLGVFTYSPEEGTPSPSFADQVRAGASRPSARRACRSCQDRIAWERAAKLVGTERGRAGRRPQRGPRLRLGGPHGRPGARDRRRRVPRTRPRAIRHAAGPLRAACASSRSRATSSSASAPSSASPRDRAALAIATAGRRRLLAVAPGTAASAVTALVLWLLAGRSRARRAPAVRAVTSSAPGPPSVAERGARRRKDPGAIVIDEVAGMTLSVLAVPLTPAVLVTGFVLFRIFDVVKPFPADASQRLGGGVGVMIDDLIAGFYALARARASERAGHGRDARASALVGVGAPRRARSTTTPPRSPRRSPPRASAVASRTVVDDDEAALERALTPAAPLTVIVAGPAARPATSSAACSPASPARGSSSTTGCSPPRRIAHRRRDRPLPRRDERLALLPQGATVWAAPDGEPGWALETEPPPGSCCRAAGSRRRSTALVTASRAAALGRGAAVACARCGPPACPPADIEERLVDWLAPGEPARCDRRRSRRSTARCGCGCARAASRAEASAQTLAARGAHRRGARRRLLRPRRRDARAGGGPPARWRAA